MIVNLSPQVFLLATNRTNQGITATGMTMYATTAAFSCVCIYETVITTYRHTPWKKFGPKRKLTVKDEMTMMLMMLRLGLTSELLGDLIGVSVSVVSQVINAWIKFLEYEPRPLICWQPKEDIQATLPDVYATFSPRLR